MSVRSCLFAFAVLLAGALLFIFATLGTIAFLDAAMWARLRVFRVRGADGQHRQ
jgi:hypothetical protein